MLERWFGHKKTPLSGAPPVRRLKSYSAQSGYVYQYYYAGHRPYRRGAEQGTEYVFEVSGDRKQYLAAAVLVADESLRDWERRHGRALGANERYGIAKLALFQALDERAAPPEMSAPVRVRPADVEAIAETLHLE